MSRNSSPPLASIVVPTRARLDYLRVALASIAPQAAQAGAELIVVDDAGSSEEARVLAARFGARYEPHPGPLGLNVARNTGVECSTGELVVFVDDDVEVCEGWLDALLGAAREHPEREVFTGPIVARLEGSPPHSCGREGAPITALDLGPTDTPTRYAWGANMAIRRSALERVGPFDVSLEHGGDEQEWQERLHAEHASRNGSEDLPRALGGDDEHTGESALEPVLYVAGAALDHRRSAADARLRPLCRGAFARGKAAQRFDAWRGSTPSLGVELLTLAGCIGHVVRYRCPAGITMIAHSAGRTREAVRERTRNAADTAPIDPARDTSMARRRSSSESTADEPPADDHTPDDFLSGESGTVGGLDGVRRATLDIIDDALEVASARWLRLSIAARRAPPSRRVLVLCVARPEHHARVERIRAELAHSRHRVELCIGELANRGKFENLNLLLEAHPAQEHDWLFVLDDDIVLPHGFLDRFLLLAERFGLDLAQPAHRRASHAAWQVTRRHPASLVRETRFVEIGPVTAFARRTFATLLPFPDLRMGWGLDMHWAALAREHGWRCGVIDAVAIRHRAAPTASSYSREQALGEARAFLAERPYLSASEAQQTLVTHRSL
jgi:GT2 family glycosyltransferase